MNLILAAADLATEGWIGLLFKIAVVCIVAAAIYKIVLWTEWPIPQPVWIVAGALIAILIIYWLIQLFQMLL